jgi:hypothetical protein
MKLSLGFCRGITFFRRFLDAVSEAFLDADCAEISSGIAAGR